MISIGNETNQTRVVDPTGAELVLTESLLSIRVGGQGWAAGIAYRAPRSVSNDRQRITIRDYVLLARLVSLAIVVLCITLRRGYQPWGYGGRSVDSALLEVMPTVVPMYLALPDA